jgi:hypothetical protein
MNQTQEESVMSLFWPVKNDGLGSYVYASAALITPNHIMLVVRDIGAAEDSPSALTSQVIPFNNPADAKKWMIKNTSAPANISSAPKSRK